MGNALRKITKKLGIFDSEEILYLARNWSNTACVGPGLTGMASVQGTLTTLIAACVINYAKCLEYVFYQGVEPTTGERLGAGTPDPREFRSYEEFLHVFLEQLRFALVKNAKV